VETYRVMRFAEVGMQSADHFLDWWAGGCDHGRCTIWRECGTSLRL